ncbi:MAG TPA: hypothetical protein PLE19_12885 [Planctomycetota bacterium]|nr:hypothetical protein [Planctomycetota bacterium]HRR82933.1 hypothetical protein [Planctomycetota bacterium]HRT94789.1 hypothetical protein [Planctomycetota bacterium]
MSTTTSYAERRVLAYVSRSQLDRCTCTLIGEATLRRPDDRRVNRQSYARPAGAVLARLVDKGLVCTALTRRADGKGEWNWRPTALGERYLATHCLVCAAEVPRRETDGPWVCGECACEEECAW